MSDGLVELDAHRDARVTRLTAEEARDLVELRRVARSAGGRARGRASYQVTSN